MIRNIKKYLVLKLLVALITIVIAILSFFCVIENTKEPILGSKGEIVVETIPNSISNDQFNDKMMELANNTGSIILSFLGEGNSDKKVYTYVGNEDLYERNLENKVYKSFDPKINFELKDYGENKYRSMTGIYLFSGDTQTIEKNLNIITDLGVNAYVSNETSNFWLIFAFSLIMNKLYILLLSIGIVSIFVLCCILQKRQKIIAERLIEGMSKIKIYKNEIVEILKEYLLMSSVILFITVCFLRVYNKFTHIGIFLNVFAELCCIFVIYFLVTFTILFFFTIKRIKLTTTIKGKASRKIISFMGAISGLLIMVIIMSFSGNLVNSTKETKITIDALKKYQKISDYNYLGMGLGLLERNSDEEIGKFIRTLDQEDKVIIVDKNNVDLGNINYFEEDKDDLENKIDSLTVNEKFIEKQPVETFDGKILNKIVDKDNVLVLVPENCEIKESVIQEKTKKFIAGEYKLNNAKLGINILKIKSKQIFSNYTIGSRLYFDKESSAISKDPIIMVVPESYKYFDNNLYLSWASHGEILIANSVDLDQKIEEYKVGKYINYYENINSNINNRIHEELVKEAYQYMGIGLSLIVMFASILILVISYLERNKQLFFMKYSNGYGFWRTHWHFMIMMSLIPLGSMLISIKLGFIQLNESSLTIPLAIIMINLIVTGVLISINQKKFNANYIKRK
ncbi:MAG: hypothetical protein LBM13_05870 [Candidatus Ancillula sp.]|jgi:hypothetical protein|nr:hypothetical protein [Candidatus Ancillula sp.]